MMFAMMKNKMKKKMNLLLPAFVALSVLGAGHAQAAPGNLEKGETIYLKRCVWCHGEDGDGLGAADGLLVPPPRDFTMGLYKFKTSPFGEDFANDADIFKMISEGMPGSDMPGWKDMLSEQDIWDLVVYLKAFAELEEEPGSVVDYGTQVASSPESIALGKSLFHENDRCSECHGLNAKGDGIKKLKGDNGERTWPRNLTKPWTFRDSSDPKAIYTRISAGIPGTQMPSFANKKSKSFLTPEQRWQVANYVISLAKTDRTIRAENTVVKAGRVEGDVPSDPSDPRWAEAELTTFMLVPQIIVKERVFTYTNDTITVAAFYNEKELSLLLEWDDRTQSIPGDPNIDKIADKVPYEDKVSVQFPQALSEGGQKPYFVMGDAKLPVNLWQWASGTSTSDETVGLANAMGYENITARDAAEAGITATGVYDNGTWRVVMKRALIPSQPDQDIVFEEGRFIPIAFANWDGSNSETGTKHTLSAWYWLLLKPDAGAKPLMSALMVAGLIFGLLIWWARKSSNNSRG